MSASSVIGSPIFQHYGILPEVEVNIDDHGHTKLDFNAEFHTSKDFERFVDDLERIQQIKTEEKIRKENPMLQRAYDDYQILLKLSK